jgi:hypothetical protein
MTVVTRSSTSGGHGVSVLESVTGTAMVGRTLFKAKTVTLALLTSSTENHLMTTARDALRMTSIFRFRTLENN